MEPIQVVYDVCRYYLEDQVGLNPDLARKLDGYRRARDLVGLASCSQLFDWDYHSVSDWRVLRQVEAFFKKNSIFSQREVCSTAAQNSFIESEKQCNATNLRLEYFYFKRDLLDPDLKLSIQRMERYISNVLGPFRSFLDDIPRLVRVTPGATSHTSRANSLPQLKMRMKLYATRSAFPYLKALYRFYGFSPPRLAAVDSNRVEFVPKNWKTDRTIACEPEGNLPLQLAFDKYAKLRLRRFGINLSDQSANQRLAIESSITNKFVTVDFKAASDTVAYNTVAWLFPPDWFKFLNDVRSPGYRSRFGSNRYTKFSSMGNGTTFTIESLVFAAACSACGSRKFLVYGDDVIIEKEYYEKYKRLTRFLGFTVNEEKSFSDGPFRESCGKDSFNGTDVTPVFIRNVDKRKAHLCHLVNSLASISFTGGKLERFLCTLVAEYSLPLVPFQESSLSGVWIEPNKARSLRILRRKSYIDKCKVYLPSSRNRTFVDSRGYYLWFLSKNSQVLFSGPWDITPFDRQPTQTSSVPIFNHAYVRRWAHWHMPVAGVPDYLYWWSEMLVSYLSKR